MNRQLSQHCYFHQTYHFTLFPRLLDRKSLLCRKLNHHQPIELLKGHKNFFFLIYLKLVDKEYKTYITGNCIEIDFSTYNSFVSITFCFINSCLQPIDKKKIEFKGQLDGTRLSPYKNDCLKNRIEHSTVGRRTQCREKLAWKQVFTIGWMLDTWLFMNDVSLGWHTYCESRCGGAINLCVCFAFERWFFESPAQQI